MQIAKRALAVARAFFLFGAVLSTSTCSSYLFDPADGIDSLARDNGFKRVTFQTSVFTLVGYGSPRELGNGQTLKIYIEGDGNAWKTRRLPSNDPTPLNPVALRLAVKDVSPILYLARPCQIVRGANRRSCDVRYWTSARFSREVVTAMNEAINSFIGRSRNIRITLVGYSGGGALATILAAIRNDVVKLITVAGTLDHEAWTRHHRVSSLVQSLNPADYAERIASLPQYHFIGAKDKIVPSLVYDSYARRLGAGHRSKSLLIPGFTHKCCWEQKWQQLLSATE